MENRPADAVLWAEGLAAQLRLLQLSCADAGPAQRQEFIAEEIERSLKDAPEGQRRAVLEELVRRFPAWIEARAPQAQPADLSAIPPEELIRQLLVWIPRMSTSARTALAEKLSQAGMVIKDSSPSGPMPMPEEMRKRLGFASDQELPAERAMAMFSILVNEVFRLETAAWDTWRGLAPRSTLKRDARIGPDVRLAMGRGILVENEAAAAQQHLERTCKLIKALLVAIPAGTKRYAEEYLIRFLPKNIEDVASSRGGGFWSDSLEKRCWGHYRELAYADSEAVGKKVLEAIAKQAEEIASKG